MSTVVAVPEAPEIVCPPWCAVSRERHVAELDGLEGFVIHWSAEGRVRSSRTSYVDGTPALEEEPPCIYVDAIDGLPAEDAEALAAEILKAARDALGA